MPIFLRSLFFSKIIYENQVYPDPNWSKIQDPDPNSMSLDPQHCSKGERDVGADSLDQASAKQLPARNQPRNLAPQDENSESGLGLGAARCVNV